MLAIRVLLPEPSMADFSIWGYVTPVVPALTQYRDLEGREVEEGEEEGREREG